MLPLENTCTVLTLPQALFPTLLYRLTDSHEDPMKEMLLFFPCFGWEYGGSEKLRD